MADKPLIFVTGAAGAVGSVGRSFTEILLGRGFPVRAVVRREDQRSAALRALGAEVVQADLTRPDQIANVMQGCKRVYFGMSIAPTFLEATVAVAAAGIEAGIEAFVNMSQMTVSQMRIDAMTDSPQQRQHWLAEAALNWSNLSVIHVRPTVFLESFFLRFAAMSLQMTGALSFPFGEGKTSPVSARDVARTVADILSDPERHTGQTYELTGPVCQDMQGVAREYSAALGKEVKYQDLPHEEWVERVLKPLPLGDHLLAHLETMARLHKQNRYDRLTDSVRKVTGSDPIGISRFVEENRSAFLPKAA